MRWDGCESEQCDSPPPQHGGERCLGGAEEFGSCTIKQCPGEMGVSWGGFELG